MHEEVTAAGRQIDRWLDGWMDQQHRDGHEERVQINLRVDGHSMYVQTSSNPLITSNPQRNCAIYSPIHPTTH